MAGETLAQVAMPARRWRYRLHILPAGRRRYERAEIHVELASLSRVIPNSPRLYQRAEGCPAPRFCGRNSSRACRIRHLPGDLSLRLKTAASLEMTLEVLDRS